MPSFAVGQPITTREPFVQVDAGLDPGTHRFQLEVVTADGRRSRPDVREVTVVRRIITDPVVRDPILRDPILRDPIDPFDPFGD